MSEVSSSKKQVSKFKKYLIYGVSVLLVAALVAEGVWYASGSNEWILEMDDKGIKVYTLKRPWTNLKIFRGVVHYDYSMSHMVAALIDDHSLETCKKWLPDCIGFQPIKKFNTDDMYDINMWVFETGGPFKPRESIIKSHVSQDDITKVVKIDITGAPDALPENDCCVRIRNFHNVWKYTPLEDGSIEVEFTQDWDMGGLFPDVIFNFGLGVEGTHWFLSEDLPRLLDNEKYRNARYDFIEEPYLSGYASAK